MAESGRRFLNCETLMARAGPKSADLGSGPSGGLKRVWAAVPLAPWGTGGAARLRPAA